MDPDTTVHGTLKGEDARNTATATPEMVIPPTPLAAHAENVVGADAAGKKAS